MMCWKKIITYLSSSPRLNCRLSLVILLVQLYNELLRIININRLSSFAVNCPSWAFVGVSAHLYLYSIVKLINNSQELESFFFFLHDMMKL